MFPASDCLLFSCFRPIVKCGRMPSSLTEALVANYSHNGVAKNWAGKWALITGASAGIGWALAEQLAAGGANLVLTARRADRLQKLAMELASQHKIRIEIFTCDLIRPEAPEEIYAFTAQKGIEVE